MYFFACAFHSLGEHLRPVACGEGIEEPLVFTGGDFVLRGEEGFEESRLKRLSEKERPSGNDDEVFGDFLRGYHSDLNKAVRRGGTGEAGTFGSECFSE